MVILFIEQLIFGSIDSTAHLGSGVLLLMREVS